MGSRKRRRGSCAGDQQGQVIVLFALALATILLMVRLVLDGGVTLATYRLLQDASDAAAIAGANSVTTLGCTSSIADVRAAAEASLARNNWGPPRAAATITCATGWNNRAVKVVATSSAGVIGASQPIVVDSTAINTSARIGNTSVIALASQMCEALYFNGSVNLTFEGSVQVNSSATGGSPCSNNSSAVVQKGGPGATITMVNSLMKIVGGATTSVRVGPAGSLVTNAQNVPDPFAALPEPPAQPGLVPQVTDPAITSLTDPSGTAHVLQPGVYQTRQIPQISAGTYLVFTPGVYQFVGEVEAIKNSGGTFCTLPASRAASFASVVASCGSGTAVWEAACPSLSAQRAGGAVCGALLYFSGFTTCASNNPAWMLDTRGTGTTLMRPYYSGQPIGSTIAQYDGFLFWFSRAHPTQTGTLPTGCQASIRGGGTNRLSGTIYGPTTDFTMDGGAAGESGTATLQFVVQDLEYKGSSTFTLKYDGREFAMLGLYGLIE